MKKILFLLGALLIMQTVFLLAGEEDIVWMKETHYNNYVEFSPNSNLILTLGQHGGNDERRGVIIFNTTGDTIKQIYNSDGLQFRDGQGIWDAHFSQDGRYLVTVWEYDKDKLSRGMLEIYDTETWASIKKIELPGDEFSLLASKVLISPDNNIIVGATSIGFDFYDVMSGQLIKQVQDYGQGQGAIPVYALYSKDGSHIYFTSSDGKLRFLNTQTFEIDYSYNAGYGILALSKDGSKIAFKTGLTGKAVQVMNIETKQIIQTISGSATDVYGIAFSKDNNHLGIVFHFLELFNIYDIQSGVISKTFKGGTLGTIDFSLNEKYIISHISRYLILLFNNTTSVNNDKENSDILYPNPTNNLVNIKFTLNMPGFTKVLIYDNTGREVKQVFLGHLEAGEQNITSDISRLKAGNYFIKVSSVNTDISFKLIINR